jgi:fumarate reductase flavoprotein subunit
MGYGILIGGGEPLYKPVDFDTDIKQVLEEGSETIFVADNIKELATKMGVNVTALEKTIEEYNQACETGRDEAFCKEARYLRAVKQPKFYASKRVVSPIGSPEGIKVNHKLEVLTKEQEIIPGLYAAGMDTACNIYRDVYVNYLPGNAFGWALNSGRMAAENAYDYLNQRK